MSRQDPSLEADMLTTKAINRCQAAKAGGRVFFHAEWGSHSATVESVITHVSKSDESGFVIGVAMPTFWGDTLMGIYRSDDSWVLRMRHFEDRTKVYDIPIDTIWFL